MIDISADGLTADGVALTFPIPLEELIGLWGVPDRWEGKANHVLTWQDLGVYAHSAGADHVKTLCVQLLPEVDGPGFVPSSTFAGTLRVDGTPVRGQGPSRGRHETVESHGFRLHLAYAGDDVESVEVVSAVRVHPPVPRERYETRRAEGEPLVFTDLNLKLAVIDELMYVQEVVEPMFALSEFVRWYDGRAIDVEAEAGRPVPEALDWFARFEIDAALAAQVRELTVDAGNEIYQHIAPQWDGEDATFDIGSWDDLALLPHLERLDFISMTPDDASVAALRARGLEVEA